MIQKRGTTVLRMTTGLVPILETRQDRLKLRNGNFFAPGGCKSIADAKVSREAADYVHVRRKFGVSQWTNCLSFP